MKEKFIKREQLKEIIDVVFDIEETTECQIFVSYSPHVDWVTLQIYINGWGNLDSSYLLVWKQFGFSFQQVKKELLNLKKGLQRIAE